MTDNPIIGRMKCPVCGEAAQDIKINKNGNLYLFCDNGCRVSFSGKVSRKIKPVLLSGNNTSLNGAFITSIKGEKQNETKQEQPELNKRIERTEPRELERAFNGMCNSAILGESRIEPIGRTDGRSAGVQPRAGTDQPKPRGIFASFLDDDDE